ncbi:hypothetical protein [Terrabacter sp. Root181]|uniref:hypothetical protein n=1 Tax=Terrabacter sp. Root181 TaxID=1736484 RepID=UPI000AAC5F87|nr:hypothetical protein [Terrabacter sp. Root181]
MPERRVRAPAPASPRAARASPGPDYALPQHLASAAAAGRPVRIGQETNYLGPDSTEVKQSFHGQTLTRMHDQLAPRSTRAPPPTRPTPASPSTTRRAMPPWPRERPVTRRRPDGRPDADPAGDLTPTRR